MINLNPRTKVKFNAVVTLIIDIVKILVTKLLPALAGMFLSFLAGMAGASEKIREEQKNNHFSTNPTQVETNPRNVHYGDDYYNDN